MLKKIDRKWVIILASSFIVSFVAFIVKNQIFNIISFVLQIPNLNFILGFIVSVINIIHKIKFKKITFSKSMTFSQFREPFDNITSFISNPITIVCSFSLFKGVYLQQIKNIIYYPKFDGLEIGFLWVIASYLLFNAISDSLTELIEIIKRTENVVVPQPLDENQYQHMQQGNGQQTTN